MFLDKMPKAFPGGQSSIRKRGLWDTILIHTATNKTTHLQPFTARAAIRKPVAFLKWTLSK